MRSACPVKSSAVPDPKSIALRASGLPCACKLLVFKPPSAQYSLKGGRSSRTLVRASQGSYHTAVPRGLLRHLQQSNLQWLQQSLNPLHLHDDDSCSVYILGVCFWAPAQYQLVLGALQQLQPDEVLIEQPQTNSELLLPHPAWIQSVKDYEQCIEAVSHLLQQQAPQQQEWQQWQQQLHAFRAELASSRVTDAKVGKDIADPFESFGYYAGLDFVRQPDSIAEVLQLCGFLPGQELVAAAQYALTRGVRLRCIDAPLKLQESWVRGLISSFSNQLDEQAVNSYTPLKDFNVNQQLVGTLPSAAAAWDRQLADAAAQLQQQHLPQQQQQPGSQADAAGDDAAAPGDSPTAAATAAAPAEQQALLLFKVSKATAAALLLPGEAHHTEVLARMARLQPLKWRHFALRTQYMAQQVKEAAQAAAKQAQTGSSDGKPKLLVVVGRQHCAALHALWSDPASSLWRTQVSRGFAPSVVEPQADARPKSAGTSTS